MFTNDMFSGMVAALILVGMALAVVLAGIAWLVYWLFTHLAWV